MNARCAYVYADGTICKARESIHHTLDSIIGDWSERHDFQPGGPGKCIHHLCWRDVTHGSYCDVHSHVSREGEAGSRSATEPDANLAGPEGDARPDYPTPSPWACGVPHPTMPDVYCVYGYGHAINHHAGGENGAIHWYVQTKS